MKINNVGLIYLKSALQLKKCVNAVTKVYVCVFYLCIIWSKFPLCSHHACCSPSIIHQLFASHSGDSKSMQLLLFKAGQ